MAVSPSWCSALVFKCLINIFMLTNLLLPLPARGEERFWIDLEEEKQGQINYPAVEKEEFYSLGQLLTLKFLKFYREYISPVDSGKCPSYPSCSHYALQAVKKHGSLLGLLLTFDRLIHEADEVHRAPLIEINGEYRYFDPVENNDFWWYKNK
ncbi:MAG: membrane protein insertion efficiency factor YidD [Thermodesulfobacteriota bacterium]